MSKVFVIDSEKRPLNPIHPAQARQLFRNKKAAVFRRFPFTIILKESRTETPVSPLRLKIDPGAKTSGIALVDDTTGEVVLAAELKHRGFAIRDALTSRRQLRRSRRNRKTRYRQPRFLNRTPPQGWLPPSLASRVENLKTWVERLRKFAPVEAISQELVRFDMQLICNPNIQGKEYRQGTLAGYETREYLLEKWGRKCAYCGIKNVPLQIEHIQGRAREGSNSVTNLCLSCKKCNLKKGTQNIKDFLKTEFHFGFQTGDIVKAVVAGGKKIGKYLGRIATRASGSLNISTKDGLVQGISHKYCTAIHKKDGYSYVA